ncbi:MAG: hypothetical protein DSM106950_11995 [Stigonema ocellatum SAG 48.90 = DSM 106950]|nr:hypothetical protein [Stigonema ocellatum SAG 48.90 = DSM 106950]
MNRVMICTLSAILSGFFGSYIGGQITLSLNRETCQNQPWGVNEICHLWVTPKAIWQGSTTGLWTGTMLGAFCSGLVTHQSRE